MHLPYDLVITLLGIYPEDTPQKFWKYICTRLFITALFVIAKRLETTSMANYRLTEQTMICTHIKEF